MVGKSGIIPPARNQPEALEGNHEIPANSEKLNKKLKEWEGNLECARQLQMTRIDSLAR